MRCATPWLRASPLETWGLKGSVLDADGGQLRTPFDSLKAHAPYGHWKTLTFIAPLRHDRIDAPWVIDGPINGELFRLYVEKVLAPTLRIPTMPPPYSDLMPPLHSRMMPPPSEGVS